MSEAREVSVRIGWSGEKVHPALQYKNGPVIAICSCPGTKNGHAKLSIVGEGFDHVNCPAQEGIAKAQAQ